MDIEQQAYAGYRITSIVTGELAPEELEERVPFGLADDEEQPIEGDATDAFGQAYDRYAAAVEEALRKAFPGAQVLVRHSGEFAIESRFAIIERDGGELESTDPEYRRIVRRMLEITDRIAVDTGDWQPTGCDPEELDRLI